MKEPFFSIIIPTLNEELFLPNLLKELIGQTAQNFEVIIVDAKSKDATRTIALEYEKKLPLKFIEINKKNVSSQKNEGAKIAVGKYLMFFDADNSISKGYTKMAMLYIQKKNGLVFDPYCIPEEKDKYPDMQVVFPIWNKFVDFSHNTNKPFSIGAGMMWERNFFNLVGGFNVNVPIAEDHEIVRNAYRWGVRVKTIHSLRLIYSLRRLKREGRLQLLYKYVLSSFYLMFNGKFEKKMFAYEMGGHGYKEELKKSKKNNNNIDSKKIHIVLKKLWRELLAD